MVRVGGHPASLTIYVRSFSSKNYFINQRFASYTHTLLLRLFQQRVASWHSDYLDSQHCSLTICVKVLIFSYNLFISWQIYFILTHNVALIETFTLICYIVTFKCVVFVLKKIGEKYKNPSLMWDPHFLLVLIVFKWLTAFITWLSLYCNVYV